jgi:hypothetical protein
MSERRWHEDVPGYGRRYYHEVIRDDGTVVTVTLLPVLTLARRARTGEAQVYDRRESVVVPSTPEEIARTEALVAEIKAGMGSSGVRSSREADKQGSDDDYP